MTAEQQEKARFFAKHWVGEALNEASEKAEMDYYGGVATNVDKCSILNAFDIDNIK